MGGDFYRIKGGNIAVDGGYNRGVLPVFGVDYELTDIAGSDFAYRDRMSEGADAFVIDKKIEEIFYSGPGGCSVAEAFIIPAEGGSEIHWCAAGKDALACERGAIAADCAEIIVFGVAEICPAVCIFHCGRTVIGKFGKRHFFLLLSFFKYMKKLSEKE